MPSKTTCKKNTAKRFKENLKTELRIITITSDEKLFLCEKEALSHEEELSTENERKNGKNRMVEQIAQLVQDILKENHWGIYFKAEPMQTLPIQDSNTTFFRVNEVKEEQLIDVITSKLQERVSEWEKDKGQNQTDKESSDGTEKT